MRLVRGLFSTALILGGIFLVGGLLIPSEWTVSRFMKIEATPQRIYPYISHFKQWEIWSPWNASKDATLKYTYTGSDKGIGAKQSWTSEKMGSGWMQFTAADPKTGVAYDLFIDMHGHQSMLHGKIELKPSEHDTLVIWTDSGNAGKSFVTWWMSLMIKPMLGRDLETGLKGLKSIIEK